MPLLREAFARANQLLFEVNWEDEKIDWNSFDKIIILKPWNWTQNIERFRKWLSEVEGLKFENSIPIVKWNLDKRYMSELASYGVPVI